jgi:hypothetical protein
VLQQPQQLNVSLVENIGTLRMIIHALPLLQQLLIIAQLTLQPNMINVLHAKMDILLFPQLPLVQLAHNQTANVLLNLQLPVELLALDA